MNCFNRCLKVFFVFIFVLILKTGLYASIEATNLMTSALKQRNLGNMKNAVNLLYKASTIADNDKQKNLALFMLGDCQLETEDYLSAVKTYENILKGKISGDEKSEAFFCLIKAYSVLGDVEKFELVYKRMLKESPSGAYSSLSKTFYSRVVNSDEVEKQTVLSKAKIEKKDEISNKTIVAKASVNKPKPTNINKDTNVKQQNSALNNKVAEQKQTKTNKNKQTTVNADAKYRDVLRAALTVEALPDGKKEELVSDILVLQDKIKTVGEKDEKAVALLFELGKSTADFGEYVEACKVYDKLLSLHPSSVYAERAYYEAIRLRALLGVHDAVTNWSEAFLAAFPSSVYTSKVKALSEYSKSGGKTGYTGKGANIKPLQTQIKDKNILLNDGVYKEASKNMKDGNYDSALNDFMKLSRSYSEIPQLWWDIALVNVQLENFKAASVAINKMVRLDPGNEDANSLSGYIHYRLEDYQKAANAYENAGEQDGQGVNFYDAKSALKRMRNSVNTTY